MKKFLVVGNWKSYITSAKDCKNLIKKTKLPRSKNIEYGICPSFFHFSCAKEAIGSRNIALGSQDLSIYKKGAHTGECNIEGLKDLGISFSLLGHSERRQMGESDELIAKKIDIALKNRIRPIICVGEKEEKKSNETIKNQMAFILSVVSKQQIKAITIAYEPVWAIGKSASESADPEYVHSRVLFIRNIIAKAFGREYAFSFPIIYGGSVKASNVISYFKKSDINGILPGSASVDEEEISKILENISKI